MASRVIKKRDGFFLLIIAMVFIVVIAKYFSPHFFSLAGREIASTYGIVKYEIRLLGIPRPEHELRRTTLPKSVPVLVYHGISRGTSKQTFGGEGRTVTLQNFEDQMFGLYRAGYHTIAISQLQAFQDGKGTLPTKPILITFDDGIKTSYYRSDPLFRVLGFQATMFVIATHAKNAEEKYYLSRPELEKMLRTGRWQIEAHGNHAHQYMEVSRDGEMGHYLSNKKFFPGSRDAFGGQGSEYLESADSYRSRVKNDLKSAKDILEDTFGVSVTAYAFPFNDFGERTKNFPGAESVIRPLATSLYSTLFYQPWAERGYTQNYSIDTGVLTKRIEVGPAMSARDLLVKLNQGNAKSLPYRDVFQYDFGWTKMWGGLKLWNRRLRLSSVADGSGSASVFLDGAGYWRNYIFMAEVNWRSGKTLRLEARFQNKNTFLGCAFKDTGTVEILKNTTEGSTLLGRLPLTLPHLHNTFHQFGIQVDGRQLSCMVDGKIVAQTELSGTPSYGGPAIWIGDPNEEKASIIVRQVRVEPREENTLYEK